MDVAIARLPKAELHCHLDGVPDPAMLRALRDQGVDLPLSPEALEAVYPVHDFETFSRWFKAQQVLDGRLDLYQLIAAQYVERLIAQGVVYAELTMGSSELPLDPEAAVDALGPAREWLRGRERDAIQVELLVVMNRVRPRELLEQLATRNIRLHAAGLISGVSLAGHEQGFPVAPLARVFDRYRDAGVPVSIHAGEWSGPESVWDTLEHGHPSRIGHGTHALEDPRLVEALIERGLHVEMCPTSNVLTGSIARIEDHPIRRAFDAGLDVSVSSDDPGAFLCTMDSEYALLAERFGFSETELRRLGANAVRARFQPRLRLPAAQALAAESSAGR